MLANFRYGLDKLIDDRCYEEGLVVPAVNAASEKEASCEEIHLMTQFGYGVTVTGYVTDYW